MTSLLPCPAEDSTNCYWLATDAGNGEGTSFIDFDGTAYYPEGVTASPDGESVNYTFDPNVDIFSLAEHFDDTIICASDEIGMTVCNVYTGLDSNGHPVAEETETETEDDSYVASPPVTEVHTPAHTETGTATAAPTPPPLPNTGNDFDPLMGLGFGLVLVFVGLSAWAIETVKKGRRS